MPDYQSSGERRERMLHFLAASEDERRRMLLRSWRELAAADPDAYPPGLLEELRGFAFLNVTRGRCFGRG